MADNASMDTSVNLGLNVHVDTPGAQNAQQQLENNAKTAEQLTEKQKTLREELGLGSREFRYASFNVLAMNMSLLGVMFSIGAFSDKLGITRKEFQAMISPIMAVMSVMQLMMAVMSMYEMVVHRVNAAQRMMMYSLGAISLFIIALITPSKILASVFMGLAAALTVLAVRQWIYNAAAAVGISLSTMGFGTIIVAAALAAGAAMYASKSMMGAQYGANFTARQPTLLLVGEKANEHVSVTPAPKHGGGNAGGSGIYVENLTVVSNNPYEFAREMNKAARTGCY